MTQDPDARRVAGWDVFKANEALTALKRKVGPEVYRKFFEQAEVYQSEMNRALRLQVESGRMSEDLYQRIKDSNDFYAPFKVLRHLEEGQRVGSGIATTAPLTKKITGITSEDFTLGNILQASSQQIVRSRILAEKNLKMLELDRLADADQSGNLIKRVTASDPTRRDYDRVSFYKDGEVTTLEVQKHVARAVQGLNPSQAGVVAKAASIAAKPFRAGATALNSSFQAVNLLFADLPRAALISRYGLRSPKDVVQFPADWLHAAYSSLSGNLTNRPNDLYMEWLKSGAANSTIQSQITPKAFKATLGIDQGPRHLAKSILDPRGSPKTGHTWSPQNRPIRSSRQGR
jgi:hypothetical protein